MSVKFSLDGVHPDYRDLVPEIIGEMVDRFPWSGLREVRLFEPKGDDCSQGNADTPGVISLSAGWLTKPRMALQEATLERFVVEINGAELGWHSWSGEPEHLLCHEYGHIVGTKLRHYESWAHERWLQMTAEPADAVSGYALATSDECWAECFTAYVMGVASPSLAVSVEGLLADHR
jgi:hypothetical protein